MCDLICIIFTYFISLIGSTLMMFRTAYTVWSSFILPSELPYYSWRPSWTSGGCSFEESYCKLCQTRIWVQFSLSMMLTMTSFTHLFRFGFHCCKNGVWFISIPRKVFGKATASSTKTCVFLIVCNLQFGKTHRATIFNQSRSKGLINSMCPKSKTHEPYGIET